MHITPGVPGIRQSRFFGMVSRGECSVGKEKRDVVGLLASERPERVDSGYRTKYDGGWF